MKTTASNQIKSSSHGQLSGFWNFAKKSISQDKEVLLYLFIAILFLYGPLFEIFSVLKNDPVYAKSIGLGKATLSVIGFIFYCGFLSLSLKVLLAFTGVHRYQGKNPTPREALKFLRSMLGFIFKLTLLNMLFEFAMMTIASIVGAITRTDSIGEAVAQTILCVTEVSKEIFIGLLIPLAVLKGTTNLDELKTESKNIFCNKLSSTFKLNLKLGLLSIVWILIVIAIATFTPQSLRDTNYFGPSVAFLFLLLIPFGHFIGVCTTLVYCRIVCLSQDASLSEEEFQRALQEIGISSALPRQELQPG